MTPPPPKFASPIRRTPAPRNKSGKNSKNSADWFFPVFQLTCVADGGVRGEYGGL